MRGRETAKTPNVFTVFQEPGPFSVSRKGNQSLLSWRRSLSFADTKQYLSSRGEVLQMLGVSNTGQIAQLLEDPLLREEARRRANQHIADLYGFEGNNEGIRNATRQLGTAQTETAKLMAAEALDNARALHETMLDETMQRLAKLADGTIRLIEYRILGRDYKKYFSVASEVEDAANPADLVGIMIDPKYNIRVRFEAKRKIGLMKMGAAVWQTTRELRTNAQYEEFKSLWASLMGEDFEAISQGTIGKPLRLSILTSHDLETFRCMPEIKELSPKRADHLRFAILPPGQKLTVLDARTFRYKGEEIPVYWDSRRKQDSAIIIKSMRDQKTNPRRAIEDELGLMGVLRSKKDIGLFIKYMLERSAATGIPLEIEEIEDTIENDSEFSARNDGSHSQLEIIKCFVRINNIRAEFMFHTFRTYVDYLYADGISHDEYSIKRFFESGVANLLYPEDIYEVPLEDLRDALTEETREHIRRPHRVMPNQKKE